MVRACLRCPANCRHACAFAWQERLNRFYLESFWACMPVLKCNMAAIALAKRGENIDRCFIGQLAGPKRARYQMLSLIHI